MVKIVITANNSAAVTWGFLVAAILVGAIVFVLLYYRRRVRNLKTEIAHVQYIADPLQSERSHFDNPVYDLSAANRHRPTPLSYLQHQKNGHSGYSDSSSNASSRGTYKPLPLLPHVNNNQHKILFCFQFTAGTYSTNSDIRHKNMMADLTNPNNEYHSIDEHLYDEIKHKDGYKDIGKIRFLINIIDHSLITSYLHTKPTDDYDHLDLDHSRPGSSSKPHYHRMNQLNITKEESELKEVNVETNNLDAPGRALMDSQSTNSNESSSSNCAQT